MNVVRIEPAKDYADSATITVTVDTKDGPLTFTMIDDGSFDGHPAWVARD